MNVKKVLLSFFIVVTRETTEETEKKHQIPLFLWSS